MTTLRIPAYLPTVQAAATWLQSRRARRQTQEAAAEWETLMVVDDPRGWYAELPRTVLIEIQGLWRAKYILPSKRGQWLGGLYGLATGTFLLGVVAQLAFSIPLVSLILGVCWGSLIGFWPGWVLGGRYLSLKPFWAVRRKGGKLEAIVPRELLHQYRSDGKPYVLRAGAFGEHLEARFLHILFAQSSERWEKMKLASLVLLMIVMGVLGLLLVIVSGDPPPPP